MNKRAVAAHHEAGHAAAVTYLGWQVLELTIDHTDDSGHCKFIPGDRAHDEPMLLLLDFMVVSLAGPIAEARIAGQATTPGCHLDYSQAAEDARLTGLPGATLDVADRRAKDAVLVHWPLVVRLAAALLDGDGRLAGHELHAVMRGESQATAVGDTR